MVLTRAQNQPGPDGVLGNADDVQNANNTDTPWVDQSQTYTSHASHQVFLREYIASHARPTPRRRTGKLLGGRPPADLPRLPRRRDGIGTWAAVKKQAATLLGLQLTDGTCRTSRCSPPTRTATSSPARRACRSTSPTDRPASRATCHPGAGPGQRAALRHTVPHRHRAQRRPVAAGHRPQPGTPRWPRLPTPTPPRRPTSPTSRRHLRRRDAQRALRLRRRPVQREHRAEHDPPDLPLRARPAGRRHQDHARTTPANAGLLAAYQARTGSRRRSGPAATATASGCSRRPASSPRWSTSTWSSRSSPARCSRPIRPFHVYSPGHQPGDQGGVRPRGLPLRPLHARRRRRAHERHADGSNATTRPLLTAFLNPPVLHNGGPSGTAHAAAGRRRDLMGSSDQTGNELDEFVTETLRNNLLGLPLDLPTINMTRAREAGHPAAERRAPAALRRNQRRPAQALHQLGRLRQHLKHPESLINFVAAYGTHPIDRRRDDAGRQAGTPPERIVDPPLGDPQPRPMSRRRTQTTSCAAPAPGRATPTA